ncbi:MAG: hypothetical protein IPO32_03665 [Crocinitomicaceae bacterium]|nr:hypothetical protein [Crocinitomicaceae bacterium]
MKAVILFTYLILSCAVNAQPIEFKTVFQPETITYNGSDNPNECWESVDQGVLINVAGHNRFFLLPAQGYELLKNKLANQEVLIEVIYFDEPTQDSHASGNVTKITFNGEIVFTQ